MGRMLSAYSGQHVWIELEIGSVVMKRIRDEAMASLLFCAPGKLRQKRSFSGGTRAQPLCVPLEELCRLPSAQSDHLEPSRPRLFGLLWADHPLWSSLERHEDKHLIPDFEALFGQERAAIS